MDYVLSYESTDLTKYIYNIEWNYTKQHSFGGVPERLIGAVLKTVERASVPWVRIPPPPPLKKPKPQRFWAFLIEYHVHSVSISCFELSPHYMN